MVQIFSMDYKCPEHIEPNAYCPYHCIEEISCHSEQVLYLLYSLQYTDSVNPLQFNL